MISKWQKKKKLCSKTILKVYTWYMSCITYIYIKKFAWKELKMAEEKIEVHRLARPGRSTLPPDRGKKLIQHRPFPVWAMESVAMDLFFYRGPITYMSWTATVIMSWQEDSLRCHQQQRSCETLKKIFNYLGFPAKVLSDGVLQFCQAFDQWCGISGNHTQHIECLFCFK